MEAKKLFTWLSEMQLKTAFRVWWMQTYQNEIVPSYRTIIRIEQRLDADMQLTKPQQKAVRRAEEFHNHWQGSSQAA